MGIARAPAASGAGIMLNGFSEPSAIRKLRSDMVEEFGVSVSFNPADMSKPDEIVGLVEATAGELGRVDILINNAGIQHTDTVDTFPVERWDAVIAINLSSNFHAIRAAVPQTRERDWGRIINIAAVHGLVASGTKSAYVAAKHGVVGPTKVVARETARIGVICNAICPGWVLTPLVQRQIDDVAVRDGIAVAKAKERLLLEKQPRANSPLPSKSERSPSFFAPMPPNKAGERRSVSIVVGPHNEQARRPCSYPRRPMMKNKIVSIEDAVNIVRDGDTVCVSGVGVRAAICDTVVGYLGGGLMANEVVRIAAVPLYLVRRHFEFGADGNVRSLQRTIITIICDRGEDLAIANVDFVGPVAVSFATTARRRHVWLHQASKPYADAGVIIFPLTKIARLALARIEPKAVRQCRSA
jgi:3-hydroxybutyrate dehydrogenase